MMWYDIHVTTVSEPNDEFVTTVTKSNNNNSFNNSNYTTTVSY